MLVLVLCLVATVLVFKIFGRAKGSVPMVQYGTPFFGAVKEFGTDPLKLVSYCQKHYGNVFKIHMGTFVWEPSCHSC